MKDNRSRRHEDWEDNHYVCFLEGDWRRSPGEHRCASLDDRILRLLWKERIRVKTFSIFEFGREASRERYWMSLGEPTPWWRGGGLNGGLLCLMPD